MSDEDTSSTGVLTDAGDADAGSTVLTGDDTNSDGVAAAAADDTGTDAGADGTGEGSGDDTGEGSQTAPDTYADFVMPEGVEVNAELLTEATPLFKKLGLNQEQAQELVDFQAKQIQAGATSQVDAFNQLMDGWREQSKNDSEFGGDKFDENVAIAQAAVSKFGTPELKQLLEEHGVGNHPEVIRFMVKVGKLTAEDVPGGTTSPQGKEQDRVAALYPNDRTA